MNHWGMGLLGVFVVMVVSFLVFKFKARHSPAKPLQVPLPKLAPEQRIMSCPECAQRMMFTVPLKGNKAQCIKCATRFKLTLDEQGNVYITELQKPENQAISSLEECYGILELQPDALPIDIRAAYKRKIMEYHPDKVEHLGSKIKQVAEDETRRINAAYAMLDEQGRV